MKFKYKVAECASGWRTHLKLAPTTIIISVYFISLFYTPTVRFEWPRFDSVLDGIGAYIALNLALLLYLSRDYFEGEKLAAHLWASAGLAAIGIFKLASSMTENMNYVLWGHVAERTLGSLVFLCAWLLPLKKIPIKFLVYLPHFTFVLSIVVAFSITSLNKTPAYVNTEIVPAVKILNAIAGSMFLIAAFIWKTKREVIELSYIGTIHSLLYFYAFSAFLYPISYLWGPRWWLVQFLELAPFLIALYEKIRTYSTLQGTLLKARAALNESNQKLEHFAYIASHDLQEPLRTISSYLTLIERKNADKLDPDSREFLSFCLNASARMRKYIVDLLNYTRIDTSEEISEVLDSNEVLSEAKANLGNAISSSAAQIANVALPRLKVARSQLLLVFQNLISNSIKYRAGAPKISISTAKKNNELVLVVSDNGVGFDSAQSESIFEMFHRAHGKHEYEGAGIGLASCKKVVEGWGGRIWATSAPGKGAVFYVAIPMSRVA
jgi:signal transduction histidine kinase